MASCTPTSKNHLTALAVELDLVDRLAGADIAQLGRAVGGEDDQRHPRLVGLDHRGRQVGRRRAGGAGYRDRPPGGLRRADGEEARTALVDVGEAADPGLAHQREHERRRARPGRGAGVLHAAARELVGQRAQQQVGVGRGHDVLSMDAVVLLHGFTHTGASWERVVRRCREATGRSRPTSAATAPRPSAAGDPRGRARRSRGARAGRAVHAGRLLDGRPDRAARWRWRRAMTGRVQRLVLIGASPGIADDAERRAAVRGRRAAGGRARAARHRGVRPALGPDPGAGRTAGRRGGRGASSTGCGTRRRGWPARCAASGRVRCHRCGSAWES